MQAPRGAERHGQAGVQMRGMEAAGKIRWGGYQEKPCTEKEQSFLNDCSFFVPCRGVDCVS